MAAAILWSRPTVTSRVVASSPLAHTQPPSKLRARSGDVVRDISQNRESAEITGRSMSNPRLEVLPLDDPDDITCMTFVLSEEDHTLGNALRWMIAKNPDVTFCGYSVPHPSESKINLRIQTNGAPATDALRKGLEDLKELCQHTRKTFEVAVDGFRSNESSQ